MWYRTFSRLIVCAVLAALAGCGGGGGGPSAPLPAAIQPTASPTPNPGAAPTPPTSAGPSSATTQATYTSANPTVTLPTVGMIASQLTLPPGLVPDGTQLSVSVSAGGASASSTTRGTAKRRAASAIAGSAWTVTVSSSTGFSLDTSQMTVTLAVGNSVSSGGTMTFYSGNGTTLTVLGTVAAASSNGSSIVFDGASPCMPSENNATNSTNSGSSTNNPDNVSNNTTTGSWNLTQIQQSSRVRHVQTSNTCAPLTAASALPLESGAFYVSDPGASAVFLFPSDANADVQPYSPLAAAPLIATDFAGELISGGSTDNREDAEIRPYGSSSIVDQLVATELEDAENTSNGSLGAGADPLGAHIGLLGNDLTNSSCAAESGESSKSYYTCPVAIDVFDRTQGGAAAPAVAFFDLMAKAVHAGLTLDPNDDAFVSGAVLVSTAGGQCGAIEFAPNFGVMSGKTDPFAVFPNSQNCNVYPDQIAVDAAGNVYVAIDGQGVLVYAPGTTVPGWMLPSSVLPNASGGPTGVGVDTQGNVYVSSPQLLSSDGSTVVAAAAIEIFGPIASWSGASTTPTRTVTGPQTGLVSPGRIAVINTSPSSPPSSSIKLTPATVSFTAAGQSQSVGVTESGYSGTFSESDSCGGIATIANASGGFFVTAAAAGTCFATIADTNGNSTKLGVPVTTTSFTISSHGRP
jgi:hypothetical protein